MIGVCICVHIYIYIDIYIYRCTALLILLASRLATAVTCQNTRMICTDEQ